MSPTLTETPQFVPVGDQISFVKFEKKLVTFVDVPVGAELYVYVEFKDKVGKMLLGSTQQEGHCYGSRCWARMDASFAGIMALSGEAEGMV